MHAGTGARVNTKGPITDMTAYPTLEQRQAARERVDNARRERREQFDLMHRDLPTALAKQTGEAWNLEHDDDGRVRAVSERVQGVITARLYVSLDEYKGRVSVHATVPPGLREFVSWRRGGADDRTTSMTVACNKGATVVARDIVRRLLADARGIITDAQARKDERDACQASAQSVADAIINAAELFAPWGRRDDRATDVQLHASVNDTARDWYGDATCRSYQGGSVSFELKNVPLALAVELVHVLARGDKGQA